MVGVVDAGEIYVRDGLRGSKAGKAVWRAGRRGQSLHLRDVRVAWSRRVINGEVVTLTAGNLHGREGRACFLAARADSSDSDSQRLRAPFGGPSSSSEGRSNEYGSNPLPR